MLSHNHRSTLSKGHANKIVGRANNRGNVAIMFALGATMMVGAVGGGIDFANASADKARAQAVLDAALLAPLTNGKQVQNTADLGQKVNSYLAGNVGNLDGRIGTATISTNTTGYHAEAIFSFTPLFLGTIGIHSINQKISSDVALSRAHLEVVYVLDNSGSMEGDALANLKEAVNTSMSEINALSARFVSVKVAVVPFSSAVNIGASNQTQSWMDTTAVSSIHDNGFSQPVNRFSLFTQLGKSWKGCVMSRPNGLNVTDDPATAGTPDSYFVPWFAPDEPDSTNSYPNTYLTDSSSGGSNNYYYNSNATNQGKARDVSKYGVNNNNKNGPWNGSKSWRQPYQFYSNYDEPQGPNFGCDTQAILPLTTSFPTATTMVNNLVALGGTNLAEGLAWGWRVISPGAPFTEARAYGSDVRKVMIFMTDGNNAYNALNNALGSEHTTQGYLADGAFGGQVGWTSSQIGAVMDAQTTEVCNNIKAQGIRIYVIRHGLSDSRSKNLLSGCASGADTYFDAPSPSDLHGVFESVTRGLLNLYLSG